MSMHWHCFDVVGYWTRRLQEDSPRRWAPPAVALKASGAPRSPAPGPATAPAPAPAPVPRARRSGAGTTVLRTRHAAAAAGRNAASGPDGGARPAPLSPAPGGGNGGAGGGRVEELIRRFEEAAALVAAATATATAGGTTSQPLQPSPPPPALPLRGRGRPRAPPPPLALPPLSLLSPLSAAAGGGARPQSLSPSTASDEGCSLAPPAGYSSEEDDEDDDDQRHGSRGGAGADEEEEEEGEGVGAPRARRSASSDSALGLDAPDDHASATATATATAMLQLQAQAGRPAPPSAAPAPAPATPLRTPSPTRPRPPPLATAAAIALQQAPLHHLPLGDDDDDLEEPELSAAVPARRGGGGGGGGGRARRDSGISRSLDDEAPPPTPLLQRGPAAAAAPLLTSPPATPTSPASPGRFGPLQHRDSGLSSAPQTPTSAGWNESTDSTVLLRHRPSILVEEDPDPVSSQLSSATVTDPFRQIINSSTVSPVRQSETLESPPSVSEPSPKELSCPSDLFASRTESVSPDESFTSRNDSLFPSDSFARSGKSFPSNDVDPLPHVSDSVVIPKEPFPPSDSKEPIPSTGASASRFSPPVSAFLSESFVNLRKPFSCSKDSSRRRFLYKMCSITDWGCVNPLCKCERCMLCGDESKVEDPFFTEVKATECPRRPPRRTRECRLGPDACSRVRFGRILSDVNDEEEPTANITSQEEAHPRNVGSISPPATSGDSLADLNNSNRAPNEPDPHPSASPDVQRVSSSLLRDSIRLPSDSISLGCESPPKPDSTTAPSDSVSQPSDSFSPASDSFTAHSEPVPPPCDSTSTPSESLSVARAASDTCTRPAQSISLSENSTPVVTSEVQLRVKQPAPGRPGDSDSFQREDDGASQRRRSAAGITAAACAAKRKSTDERVLLPREDDDGDGRLEESDRRASSASLFACSDADTLSLDARHLASGSELSLATTSLGDSRRSSFKDDCELYDDEDHLSDIPEDVVLRRGRGCVVGRAGRCGPGSFDAPRRSSCASDDASAAGGGGLGGFAGGGGGGGGAPGAWEAWGEALPYWRRRGSSLPNAHLDAAQQRRPSALSWLTDEDHAPGGPGSSSGGATRSWRAPSVVVSDYSDDVPACYANVHDPDDPASGLGDDAASCSSGTVVCALRTPERKASDCSTCSTLSGADDDRPADSLLQPLRSSRAKPSGWRKLRSIVQWTPFFQTYKNKQGKHPWVQLAGHQGNFKAGPEQGTILKKLCPKEELCFQVLMEDKLRPFVPEYKGQVACEGGDLYLQLQDLLGDFVQPCVMDCKIGVRTYLEEELAKAKEKPKLRKDMYDKMIQIDKDAPTEEEHRLKGVTKPRYMVWRETISSTATLGFRIEGIRKSDGKSSKDFKTTKSRSQVMTAFQDFTEGFPHAVPKYIQRLKDIRATLEQSEFFSSHEVIGSSLLFVHDRHNASVWLIDFAKTLVLPSGIKIDHSSHWVVGNHEDGYLIGINNIIEIFMELKDVADAKRAQQALMLPTTVVTGPSDASEDDTA